MTPPLWSSAAKVTTRTETTLPAYTDDNYWTGFGCGAIAVACVAVLVWFGWLISQGIR